MNWNTAEKLVFNLEFATENAIISVLSAQTELASIEVIRGKEAATHATFPRIVVSCKGLASLIPGQTNPYKAMLELTVQTEAKVDIAGDTCEGMAEAVSSALLPPNGVTAVDATFTDGKIHKLEFQAVEEMKMVDEDHYELDLKAEIYLQI